MKFIMAKAITTQIAYWKVGEPFEIVDPGIAVKLHPCCGSTHPAVDAAIALKREHNLKLDDIESVLSWTHPRRLKHTNRPSGKHRF